MTTKRAPKASTKKPSKKSPKRLKAAEDLSCLLTYLPSTYPVPIQTGTGQTPARARLNTAVLAGGQNVYCDQIVIAVQVGTEAGDLFQQTPVASVNTGKWAVARKLKVKGSELGLDHGTDYATFTFDCRDQSDYLINYNLVFGLEGVVTNVPAQCVVQIMENSGTSKDPSTFTAKTCSYTVATSSPQFYLTNFAATAAAAPTVPATQFANGADISLSWESNGTFFQIYQKDNPRPVWAGSQTSCTLKGGVKTDTTFFLVAMVSGDPGGDHPQSGYQPIYLYDALTVTVSNPDLTPNTSTIAGSAGVGGTLNVKGNTTLANTAVGGKFDVTGNSTLKGALTVVGGLRLEQNVSVGSPGLVEVDAPGVRGGRFKIDGNGNVGIGAPTPGSKLSVAGDAEISGTLKATGALRADGASFLFANGSNDASSDVVLRKDENFAYLFPWGTGTKSNLLNLGGGATIRISGAAEFSGNVGIGVKGPRVPFHVFSMSEQFDNASIIARGSVLGAKFINISDGRIKEVLGRSDGAADLRTLLAIEVTDYRHKDAPAEGSDTHKKFIAQQVERVFPQAVGRTTDAVPDIYRQAPCAGGWVELATDLKAGERVRLIAGEAEGVYEVLEADGGRFRTGFAPAADAVFVYGREVNDFRTLDYDAVAALNVSATQQLKREKDEEVESLRAECVALKAANGALVERLERLESKVESALRSAAYTANGTGRKL